MKISLQKGVMLYCYMEAHNDIFMTLQVIYIYSHTFVAIFTLFNDSNSLTRTWPSEVPWSPSASSPLAPSSSAWSQLEDGPPLARRGSGTGSPLGRGLSSGKGVIMTLQCYQNVTNNLLWKSSELTLFLSATCKVVISQSDSGVVSTKVTTSWPYSIEWIASVGQNGEHIIWDMRGHTHSISMIDRLI